MKKILLLGISLYTFCISCSQKHSANIPKQYRSLKNLKIYCLFNQHLDTIHLQRQQVLGNAYQHPIGRLKDVAVDSSGRVYIADNKQNNIKVYKPNGQFIKQLGRKGKGPGEFTSIWNIQIKNHKLFAEDLDTDRFNVFNLYPICFNYTVNLASNRQAYSRLKNTDPKLTNVYVRNNSTYLVEFTKSNSSKKKVGNKVKVNGLYYFLDKSGNILPGQLFKAKISTLISIPWPPPHPTYTMKVNVPFYRKSMTVLSGDNHIFWIGPDNFLIKVYSPRGVYKHAIYYSYKRVSLTRKSASNAGISDFLINNMQLLKLPKAWPAINNMKIDSQNRLWITTIVKNMKIYQWWVLNRNGKLLARFRWPRSKKIEVIKNGKVYTKETNKQGVPRIVRYRIQMQ